MHARMLESQTESKDERAVYGRVRDDVLRQLQRDDYGSGVRLPNLEGVRRMEARASVDGCLHRRTYIPRDEWRYVVCVRCGVAINVSDGHLESSLSGTSYLSRAAGLLYIESHAKFPEGDEILPSLPASIRQAPFHKPEGSFRA